MSNWSLKYQFTNSWTGYFVYLCFLNISVMFFSFDTSHSPLIWHSIINSGFRLSRSAFDRCFYSKSEQIFHQSHRCHHHYSLCMWLYTTYWYCLQQSRWHSSHQCEWKPHSQYSNLERRTREFQHQHLRAVWHS